MYNANLNFYFKRVDDENFQSPFHSHKCYELVYYNTGCGHCLIDGKSFNYEKNEFVLIPISNKSSSLYFAHVLNEQSLGNKYIQAFISLLLQYK